MLVEFIRNENREPVGCVVAIDRDCIGVSLLNPKDKFNREVARNLAAGRALSGIVPDVRGRKEEIVEKIKSFKYEFKERPGWEKGSPKRVNNLTMYGKKEEREGKANMPGHVRAAMNWNNLRRMYNDNYSMQIIDGMKTIVCKLKPNPLEWTSIGYPTDEQRLPKWFTELPFDDGEMESTIVDQKVENLLGVLEWRIAESTDIKTTFDTLFSFD